MEKKNVAESNQRKESVPVGETYKLLLREVGNENATDSITNRRCLRQNKRAAFLKYI